MKKSGQGLESERGRFLHSYLERGQIITKFTFVLTKRGLSINLQDFIFLMNDSSLCALPMFLHDITRNSSQSIA